MAPRWTDYLHRPSEGTYSLHPRLEAKYGADEEAEESSAFRWKKGIPPLGRIITAFIQTVHTMSYDQVLVS